ncbi:MAG: ester cyclase [Chloroflexi bacterium]|nr:MAG: ester cyclase [Chloroflexota bacterium]
MGKLEAASKQFVEAFNRHDPDAVAAGYATDCVVNDPAYPVPLVGRNAVREDAAKFFRAFPDLRIESLERFEKGDFGAEEFRMTGTNTGPLEEPAGEIAATGKRIDLKGAAVIRFDAQGLVREERRYYDAASLIRQLGLAPEPAGATTR